MLKPFVGLERHKIDPKPLTEQRLQELVERLHEGYDGSWMVSSTPIVMDVTIDEMRELVGAALLMKRLGQQGR